MSKFYACIISADAKKDRDILLSVAQRFSSGIEVLENGVLFDVSGLHNLVGDADTITKRIERRIRISSLDANAAVAESADTAILLAKSKIAAQTDTFAQVPLRDLPIDEDTLGIFDALGIRKIDDLKRIPADDLVNRYGQKFRDVIDVIDQKGGRFLTPNVKENSLTWSYDLDFPVEDFERLIFIVNHGLNKLLTQTFYCALSTEQLDIFLGLQHKSEKSYEIKTSFPTLEKSFWLKLVNLRIALDPPEAEIVSIRVVLHFTSPRPNQRGLFSVSRPEPESLLLTVNKIKKLVGEDNVGVPIILDQSVSETFSIAPDQLPKGREKLEIESESLTAAFYYFRPPLSVSVTVEDKSLLFISTAFWSGRVKKYSGVWKTNSHWWNLPWSNCEWDVEVENGGVYRLRKASDEWVLTGEYD